MVIYHIYTFTNLVNGKVYVGQTKQDPTIRFNDHLQGARDGESTALHLAIRKYGESKFKFEVIACCKESVQADELESQFIADFNSCLLFEGGYGYNMTTGGKGMDSTSARHAANRQIIKGVHSSQIVKTCQFCGYSGRGPYVRRFHLENCRHNPLYDSNRDIFEKEVQARKATTRSSTWEIIDPEGNIKVVKNLTEYCRNKKLCAVSMRTISKGKKGHFKGYKCRKLDS